VGEALQLLTKHNVLSLPVGDSSKKQYRGMVDVEDIVSLFLSTLNSEYSPEKADWKFNQVPIESAINFSHSDVFLPMDGETSVWHLIEVFTRGIHRIPVLNHHGNVINIVSQSSVVKFLSKRREVLGPPGEKTLSQLRAVQEPVTIEKNIKTLEAFSLLHDRKVVDALAIVDENGRFCGSISNSSLRGLGYELFSRLQLPVSEFVEEQRRMPLDNYCCKGDMKLAPAIHYMAKNGLHRLWILDDDRKPTGVVTLLDIMKALMVVSKGSFRDWQRRMSNAPDERPVGLSL